MIESGRFCLAGLPMSIDMPKEMHAHWCRNLAQSSDCFWLHSLNLCLPGATLSTSRKKYSMIEH